MIGGDFDLYDYTEGVPPDWKFSFWQEYPELSMQPEWDALPEQIDWQSCIAEVLERGKAVPEVEFCLPGEDNARKVRVREMMAPLLHQVCGAER